MGLKLLSIVGVTRPRRLLYAWLSCNTAQRRHVTGCGQARPFDRKTISYRHSLRLAMTS